ncbi:hypothetical protein I3843_11G098900 [Carya illinoinensis]|nr:hypothetical protein I3843_11G098900 [Carya illinoinensis]
MGRSPCCSKDQSLNRGTWTATEDKILKEHIKMHGEGKWRNLPKKAGLNRCGKSCRLRWLNYLRPGIKRGNITNDEEELIIRLHKLLGNRWSLIAGRLPGRTDNEIKNYWNTKIGKKVLLGHPNPTSKRRSSSSNQAQEKPNPTEACTKVTLMSTSGPQEPRHHHQEQQLNSKPIVVEGPSIVHDENHDTVDFSNYTLEENNPSNFTIDCEIDKSFLSEFLINPDFLEMSCFEKTNNNKGGSITNITTCNKDHSSPTSIDHALLVSQETKLHGSEDCQLMAPPTEADQYLDWLFVSEDTLLGSEENSDDQSNPTLSAPKDRCF